MFESEYLILCTGKSSDANGNVTISGIFDTLFANGFPTVRPNILVAAQLRAKEAVVDTEISVKLEVEIEDEVIMSAPLEQNITIEQDNSANFDFNLEGMAFPRAGKYYFKLYTNDTIQMTRLLRVRSADELTEA